MIYHTETLDELIKNTENFEDFSEQPAETFARRICDESVLASTCVMCHSKDCDVSHEPHMHLICKPCSRKKVYKNGSIFKQS